MIATLILAFQLIWFFLAAGVANMSPVLIQNHLQPLAKPVDGGMMLGGRPLFGDHKTWRGLIVAAITGGVFFMAQQALAFQVPLTENWAPFDLRELPWWLGFVMGTGAILGDLVKSFFKRRFAVAPGKSWIPFDQIDFIVGAAIFVSWAVNINFSMWAMMLLLGPFLHIFANHLGYWLKLKDSAW